jgi:hypothetical protein
MNIVYHVNYKGNHQQKIMSVLESSRAVYFSIALLITVLYRQNHRQIENSSVLFGGFLKNFD